MLLDGLYRIIDLKVVEHTALAKIIINKDHDIFKGHFPDNPVMPGVCMMQIIKEITEKIVDKKLFMQSASNIKFLALINPYNTPELELDIDVTETDEGYKVKNISKFEDTIALKATTYFTVK